MCCAKYRSKYSYEDEGENGGVESRYVAVNGMDENFISLSTLPAIETAYSLTNSENYYVNLALE
jgi:hypothetical protein